MNDEKKQIKILLSRNLPEVNTLTSGSFGLPPDQPQIPDPSDPRFPPDQPQIPDPDEPYFPPDQPLEPNCSNYNIIRFRENKPNKYYLSTEDSNFSRGDILRQACAEAYAGDILQLNIGVFDINASEPLQDGGKGDLVFPVDVTIKGMGMNRTVLFAKKDGDGRDLGNGRSYDGGMPFQLTNTVLEDLTLECRPDSLNQNYLNEKGQLLAEDAQTVGYYFSDSWIEDGTESKMDFNKLPSYRKGENRTLVKFSSSLLRCRIISNAWAFYTWSNIADQCNLIECEIISGRQGVSVMGTGAYGDSHASKTKINIYRCLFNIDVNNDYVDRDSSDLQYDGAYAVISRAAQIKIVDCDFYLKGDTTENGLKICIGISDKYTKVGHSDTNIKSFNNRFYINPNRATLVGAFNKRNQESIIYSQNDYIDGVFQANYSYDIERK